jgi:hypothetical protein
VHIVTLLSLQLLLTHHTQVSTEFGAGHGKAGLLLVAGMYKLLAGVLSTRSQRVQELLPRATTLSLQMLSACTAAARQHRQQSSSSSSSSGGSREHDVLDAVMPDFLAVVGSICDSQVSCEAVLSLRSAISSSVNARVCCDVAMPLRGAVN